MGIPYSTRISCSSELALYELLCCFMLLQQVLQYRTPYSSLIFPELSLLSSCHRYVYSCLNSIDRLIENCGLRSPVQNKVTV